MNTKVIGIMYGFIAIRIFLLYLSTTISSNIMNQIYTERVLINGEEPPVLNYELYLFLVLDLVFNLLLLAAIYGILQFKDSKVESNDIFTSYTLHYVVSLVIIFVLSMIVSNTMYRKKYFLYKDDGLRAIRALNDIVFKIGCVVSLMPFFMLGSIDGVQNAANQIKKLQETVQKRDVLIARKEGQAQGRANVTAAATKNNSK